MERFEDFFTQEWPRPNLYGMVKFALWAYFYGKTMNFVEDFDANVNKYS